MKVEMLRTFYSVSITAIGHGWIVLRSTRIDETLERALESWSRLPARSVELRNTLCPSSHQ